ncbi:MAG: glycosyltransferase [Candidatus Latescibacterota bacterium]|jgi:glycosyltransferase involved in cell wall biosynthesis
MVKAPVRVLQVVTRLAVRGVPRHVLSLAAGLDRSRFHVEILAGRSEPGEGEWWDEAGRLAIPTWRVPALQRQVNPVADLAAYAAISRRLREGRYDLVHTHISKAGILGRLAAVWARVPVVVHTYHGQVAELSGTSPASLLFRACERVAARRTDRLVAVSQDTARACLAMGIGRQDQYRVIHGGIEVSRFSDYAAPAGGFPGGPGGPRLGAIGSLTEEKGFEVLLRAMPAIRAREPGTRLWIIGSGPLQPRLVGLARESDLGGAVAFPGIVEDVRPWLAGLDLLVVPSRREGLGLVILEGMAMGIPVVASRVGGIPEVVVDGETGLLVEAGDPASLAAAALTLLADPERRRRMGRAGRQRAIERFSLETMSARIAEEYELLLAARQGNR